MIARSFLEAYGVRGFIPFQYHVATAWHHTFALGGVGIDVVAGESEQAQALLGSVADPGAAEGGFSIGEVLWAVYALSLGVPHPLTRRGKTKKAGNESRPVE